MSADFILYSVWNSIHNVQNRVPNAFLCERVINSLD